MAGSPLESSAAATRGSALGALALSLILLGPIVAYTGIASPMIGFVALLLGLLSSLVGLVSSVIGFLASRAPARRGARPTAVRGLVLSSLALAVVAYPALQARGLPRINDISTDVDDPPVFVHAATLPGNIDRDLSYPGESFARQQVAAYPDLGPLLLDIEGQAALQRVSIALAGMDATTVTHTDLAGGTVEATATSRLFHFVDDIVVRVRSSDFGSRIDVRSKSRDGRGDLGANAARIHALLEQLD